MRLLMLVMLGAVLAGTPANGDTGDAKALAVCEALLKRLVKSPPTYVRVDVGTRADPIEGYKDFTRLLIAQVRLSKNLDAEAGEKWFRDYVNANREEYHSSLAAAELHGRERLVVIEYDAQNSFGALLRGRFRCGFFDETGKGQVSLADLTAVGSL